MWHHHPDTSDFRPHRGNHVLNPGEVAIRCWRQAARRPAPRVMRPNVGAPVLETERRIGDDDIEPLEPAPGVEELWLTQGVTPQHASILDVVKKEVHPGNS